MSFKPYPQLSNQNTAPKNFNSSSLNNSTSNQNHPPFKLPAHIHLKIISRILMKLMEIYIIMKMKLLQM